MSLYECMYVIPQYLYDYFVKHEDPTIREGISTVNIKQLNNLQVDDGGEVIVKNDSGGAVIIVQSNNDESESDKKKNAKEAKKHGSESTSPAPSITVIEENSKPANVVNKSLPSEKLHRDTSEKNERSSARGGKLEKRERIDERNNDTLKTRYSESGTDMSENYLQTQTQESHHDMVDKNRPMLVSQQKISLKGKTPTVFQPPVISNTPFRHQFESPIITTGNSSGNIRKENFNKNRHPPIANRRLVGGEPLNVRRKLDFMHASTPIGSADRRHHHTTNV